MTHDAFLNMSFESQLIKSPNLAKLYILTKTIIFRNCLNNLVDWGLRSTPFLFNNLLQLLNKQL